MQVWHRVMKGAWPRATLSAGGIEEWWPAVNCGRDGGGRGRQQKAAAAGGGQGGGGEG